MVRTTIRNETTSVEINGNFHSGSRNKNDFEKMVS